MRDITSKMKTAPIVLFRNLPGTITEAQLSDYLSKECGLCVNEDCISVRQSDHNVHAAAIVCFSRECIADFLNRALANIPLDGHRVYCAPPKPRMRKLERD